MPYKIRNSVVSLQFQQTKRNRKIKTRSFLSYMRRRKVDGYSLAARPSQSAVAYGGCDAIFAFLYRGVRKSNHRDLVRVTPSCMDFNFHLKGIDTDDCSGIDLSWHNRLVFCFNYTVFASVVFSTFWSQSLFCDCSSDASTSRSIHPCPIGLALRR